MRAGRLPVPHGAAAAQAAAPELRRDQLGGASETTAQDAGGRVRSMRVPSTATSSGVGWMRSGAFLLFAA
jgi:hypothetical protein